MISDHLSAVSWSERPGSFTGLMTLYESNYVRLQWLLPQPSRLSAGAISVVPGEPPLELSIAEVSRYTTAFTLSYLFEEDGGTVRDPGLEVVVYHDARLAEARSVGVLGPGLRRIAAGIDLSLDRRWSRNMLLNKWLEFCAERGHSFAAACT